MEYFSTEAINNQNIKFSCKISQHITFKLLKYNKHEEVALNTTYKANYNRKTKAKHNKVAFGLLDYTV